MHDYCNNLLIFFLGGAVLDHLFNNCHIKNKFCSSNLLLFYLQSKYDQINDLSYPLQTNRLILHVGKPGFY